LESTTLQHLANVGEILGAIGVIVSLVYLAAQIRQNTRSVQASAYQTMYRSSIEMSAFVGQDAGTSGVLRRGLQGHDQLSEDELVQFRAIMQGLFSGFVLFFGMWRRGLIDDLEWEPVVGNMRFYLRAPGGMAWWPMRMPLDTRFTRFVEEKILDSLTGSRAAADRVQ